MCVYVLYIFKYYYKMGEVVRNGSHNISDRQRKEVWIILWIAFYVLMAVYIVKSSQIGN